MKLYKKNKKNKIKINKIKINIVFLYNKINKIYRFKLIIKN